MAEKALVLFSGGVDSTTCLGLAIERFGKENVIPLSIHYGQKHDKEVEAAEKILEYYGIEGMEMDLSHIFAFSSCSLLAHSDEEIPEASYAEQLNGSEGAPGLHVCAVPQRAVPLLRGKHCALKGCSRIYYGAHRDDAAGSAYPDCSESFYKHMDAAVFEGSGHALHIEAPFITMNKAQVVAEGLRLKVPYEYTWSCYEGKERPCGVCGTCIDRQRAFEANGVKGSRTLLKRCLLAYMKIKNDMLWMVYVG